MLTHALINRFYRVDPLCGRVSFLFILRDTKRNKHNGTRYECLSGQKQTWRLLLSWFDYDLILMITHFTSVCTIFLRIFSLIPVKSSITTRETWPWLAIFKNPVSATFVAGYLLRTIEPYFSSWGSCFLIWQFFFIC